MFAPSPSSDSLLASAVLRGRSGLADSGVASAAASLRSNLLVDEVHFAVPVTPRTLRVIARGPPAHVSLAAESVSSSRSGAGGVVSDGVTFPLAFELEVWATRSDERQTHDDTAASATNSGPYPWEAGASNHWRCLLGPAHDVSLPPRGGSNASRLFRLSPRMREGDHHDDSADTFATRRLVLRGNYVQLRLAVYGSVCGDGGLALTSDGLREKRSQLSGQALAAAPAIARRAHPCFRACVNTVAPRHLSSLIFDSLAAPAVAADLESAWTDHALVRRQRAAITRVATILRRARLVTELGRAPDATMIDADTLEELSAELREIASNAARLDDISAGALFAHQYEPSTEFARDAQHTIGGLSFLVATAAPPGSLLASPPGAASAAALRRFAAAFQTALPTALVQSIADVLVSCLRSSTANAACFVEQGASWIFMLGWLSPTRAGGDPERDAGPIQQRLAARLLVATLHHPVAFESLTRHAWLPPIDGGASVLSLLQHGLLSQSASTSSAAAASPDAITTDQPPAALAAALTTARRLTTLHHLFVRARDAYDDMSQLQTDDTPPTPERLHAAFRRTFNALRQIVRFLRHATVTSKSSDGSDTPICSELAHAFLHHAHAFELLQMLQSLVESSDRGETSHVAPHVRSLVSRIVQPLLLRIFFARDAPLQASLHFCAQEHQLLGALAKAARQMKKSAAKANGPTEGEQTGTTSPPHQHILRLVEWAEGRIQAIMLLTRCAEPLSGEVADDHLRISAWSCLNAFLHGHPFGVAHVAHILERVITRTPQTKTNDVVDMRDDDSQNSPAAATRAQAVLRCLVQVFSETSSAAGEVMQHYAVDASRLLLASARAPALFLGDGARVPLPHTSQLPSPAAAPADETEVDFGVDELTHMCQVHARHDHAPRESLLPFLDDQLSTLLRRDGHPAASDIAMQHITAAAQCLRQILDSNTDIGLARSNVEPRTKVAAIAEKMRTLARAHQRRREVLEYVLSPRSLPPHAHSMPTGPSSHAPASMNLGIVAMVHRLADAFAAPTPDDAATSSNASVSLTHALSASAITALQQAARCVDAVLVFLARVLESVGDATSRQYASLPLLETGEVATESSLPPPPAMLVQLGALHDALWRLWEAMATNDICFHHFVDAPEPANDTEHVPAPFEGQLGHFPRIRSQLVACTMRTIWCAHDTARSRVDPSSVPQSGEEGLPRLAHPPQETAIVRFITRDLLHETRPQTWLPNMQLLADMLASPEELASPPVACLYEEDETPSRRQQDPWRRYMGECFWPHLFGALEFGSNRSVSCLDAPACLLSSSFFSSPVLVEVSCPRFAACLSRLLPSIVDQATPNVGAKVLESLVAHIARQARVVADELDARRRQTPVPEATTKRSAPQTTQSAAAAAASFRLTHHAAYRQLQLLHALLRRARSRWLLNDLDIVQYLQPYLQLSGPAAASRNQHPGAPFQAHIQEAIAFQTLALECVRAAVDTSATRLVLHGASSIDADFHWSSVRVLMPELILHLFASASTIPTTIIAALRIFVAMSHTRAGCVELLRTVASRVYQSPPALGPSSADPPTTNATPLLVWLTRRIEEVERDAAQDTRVAGANDTMSDAPVPPPQTVRSYAVELELWGLAATLLRGIMTLGLESAPDVHRAEDNHLSSAAPDASSPPVTDSWWAATLSRLYPGLKPLCIALGWPVRSSTHAADARELVSLPSLPFQAIAPDHPLPRIVSRLAHLESMQLDARDALAVAPLRRAFTTLVHRLSMAHVLHVVDAHALLVANVNTRRTSAVEKFARAHPRRAGAGPRAHATTARDSAIHDEPGHDHHHPRDMSPFAITYPTVALTHPSARQQ